MKDLIEKMKLADDRDLLIRIISMLSNIVWNYSDHKERMSLDSVMEDLKGMIDSYNLTHDKKINY